MECSFSVCTVACEVVTLRNLSLLTGSACVTLTSGERNSEVPKGRIAATAAQRLSDVKSKHLSFGAWRPDRLSYTADVCETTLNSSSRRKEITEMRLRGKIEVQCEPDGDDPPRESPIAVCALSDVECLAKVGCLCAKMSQSVPFGSPRLSPASRRMLRGCLWGLRDRQEVSHPLTQNGTRTRTYSKERLQGARRSWFPSSCLRERQFLQ